MPWRQVRTATSILTTMGSAVHSNSVDIVEHSEYGEFGRDILDVEIEDDLVVFSFPAFI